MALHTSKNIWTAQIRLKACLFVFKGHEIGRVGNEDLELGRAVEEEVNMIKTWYKALIKNKPMKIAVKKKTLM